MAAKGPGGPAGARRGDPQALLGAGTKAYDWLKKALGVYGTAVTLVQLVPAAVTLLLVFLSPTAWLSVTLRRWVGFGSLVGAVLGMVLFARAAGPRNLADLVRGSRLRSSRLAGVAWWGLGLGVVSAAAFRLHLAVVDVQFVNAVPVLTPVLDYYLGGGPGAAILYNALAAGLAGLALTGVVAGAPAAVLRWRERRMARRALEDEGGALGALDKALRSLEAAKAAVEASRVQIAEMAVELEDLRAAAGRPAAAPANPQVTDAPGAGQDDAAGAHGGRPAATSAADRRDRPAPRAAAGRPPR